MNNNRPSAHTRWVLSAVELYERRLTRYALHLIPAEESARDAVQHAFLKLCDTNSDDRIHGETGSPLAAWLFTVCRNKALDILRHQNRVEAFDDESRNVDHRELPPPDRAEKSEEANSIRQLLKILTPPQQETLQLWSEGFTYREIAAITQRNEGAIRTLVHRAIVKLREHPGARRLLVPGDAPCASDASAGSHQHSDTTTLHNHE